MNQDFLAGPFTRIARAIARDNNIRVLTCGTTVEGKVETAATDGTIIKIPFNADDLDESTRRVLHGLLDHEVSHVIEERRHREASRETPLEMLNERRPPKGLAFLFNVFEDHRINKRQSAAMIGIAENIAFSTEHSIKKLLGRDLKTLDPFLRVGMAISFALSGRESDVTWLDGMLEGFLDRIRSELKASPGTAWGQQTYALGESVHAKLLQLFEDEESKAGATSSGAYECELEDLMDVAKEDIHKKVAAHARETEAYIPHPGLVELDRIEVASTEADGLKDYIESRKQIETQIGVLCARQRVKLQIQTRSKVRPNQEEGELDSEALLEMQDGATDIYCDVVRGRRLDTAVELLIDCSGSMYGTPAYAAKCTAIALSETWSSLRIPFEVLWYTNYFERAGEVERLPDDGVTTSRTPLDVRIVKGWNETLQVAKPRYATIQGYGDNSDSDAVLVAARRLVQRREKNKILVVMSDGIPAVSCKVARGDMHAHLRETVRKIEKIGIPVFGFGILTDRPKIYYPRLVYIESLETMAGTVCREMDRNVRKGLT